MHGCCDNLGCLQVSASRLGEDLDVRAWRIGCGEQPTEGLDVDAWRVGSGILVSANIVCSVLEEEEGYELFLVTEGGFILADGKKLKVVKYEL